MAFEANMLRAVYNPPSFTDDNHDRADRLDQTTLAPNQVLAKRPTRGLFHDAADAEAIAIAV